MIADMDRRLRGILALLALLPSLAILLDFISLPPTQEQILRITIMTVSLCSAICVFLLSDAFQSVRLTYAVLIIVLFTMLGIGSLYSFQEVYLEYHETCTVDDLEIGIFLPLSPGPIQEGYGATGVCGLAQDDKNLGDEIESLNRGTRILLSLLLALGQLGLTMGLLFGIVRVMAIQKE